MSTQIFIGDQAKTIGPLKPTGKVRVNGHTLDACSEGEWIDSDADVVIIGGNTQRAVVRACSDRTNHVHKRSEPLPAGRAFATTPLQSPPAWVERINAVVIGGILGIVVIPLVWFAGAPITPYAALVPVAGAVAGWLFRIFVGNAIQSVGPREDHRPRARGIASVVLISAVIGSAVGLNIGPGFLGLCCGLVAGAFVGGTLTCLGLLVSECL